MVRESVDILESYCIIVGLLTKGVTVHGPFRTFEAARRYGDKNFPDDTREITVMYRELLTHERKSTKD